MEEKKKEMAKDGSEKMTYEQLNNVAHQLSEQAKILYQKLKEANMSNMFKRLDYLFKVVEYSRSFDAEFVTSCVEEIEEMMTLPKEEETKE